MTSEAKHVPSGDRSDWREELLRAGFSPEVLIAADVAREAGLFTAEPSDDLLQQTIARCRPLLQKSQAATEPSRDELAEVIAAHTIAFSDLTGMFSGTADRSGGALQSANKLVTECLATADFVYQKRRPMVVVDSHDVIEPSWWKSDTCLVAMREAMRSVDDLAIRHHAPTSAVVMVLRAGVQDYSTGDIQALEEVIETAKGDLWLVPSSTAIEYRHRDVMVLGDRVLTLDERLPTPVAAVQAIREEGNPEADGIREAIEELTNGLQGLRIGSRPNSVGAVRSLIADVTTSGLGIKISH